MNRLNEGSDNIERLWALCRMVEKECEHLAYSTKQVFSEPFTAETAQKMDREPEFAVRVEAYVSRYRRLQDTLADKLLPVWLKALGEPVRAAIDNLDKAEKLGMLTSSYDWLLTRQLRNQMIHEYMESPVLLADALNTAHQFQPVMESFAHKLLTDIQARGLR